MLRFWTEWLLSMGPSPRTAETPRPCFAPSRNPLGHTLPCGTCCGILIWAVARPEPNVFDNPCSVLVFGNSGDRIPCSTTSSSRLCGASLARCSNARNGGRPAAWSTFEAFVASAFHKSSDPTPVRRSAQSCACASQPCARQVLELVSKPWMKWCTNTKIQKKPRVATICQGPRPLRLKATCGWDGPNHTQSRNLIYIYIYTVYVYIVSSPISGHRRIYPCRGRDTRRADSIPGAPQTPPDGTARATGGFHSHGPNNKKKRVLGFHKNHS